MSHSCPREGARQMALNGLMTSRDNSDPDEASAYADRMVLVRWQGTC